MKTIIYVVTATAFLTSCSVYKPINNNSNSHTKPVATSSAQLIFPVAGNKSNIGSFWGDARDGGKRRHEGIDIFARRGTEVVAVCDGEIVSVGNDGIGGKTIWLLANDYAWEAYYAHLDSQFVQVGQTVTKGDIIGSVGNTGNAKSAPPHLHFGIYTNAGAVDPLPYVKTASKVSSTVVVAESANQKPVKRNSKTKISTASKRV